MRIVPHFICLCFLGAAYFAERPCFAETIYEETFPWVYGSTSNYVTLSPGGSAGTLDDFPELSFEHYGFKYGQPSDVLEGRTRIYNWGNGRTGVLVMDDVDSANGSPDAYSLNYAIVTLTNNLAGWSDINLTFGQYDSNDSETSGSPGYETNMNGSHAVGTHKLADGVSFRSLTGNNNGTWYTLTDLFDHNGMWRTYSSDTSIARDFSFSSISDIAAANNLDLSQGIQIKFQQYDNGPHTGSGQPDYDGRKFDNFLVTGTRPPGDNNLVPEPSSWTLFGIGLAAMYGYRRRQKANVKA